MEVLLRKPKLTIEMAIRDNLTNIECVKYYFPDITDLQADNILWEETCFPFDTEVMLSQLYTKYSNE